MKRENTWVKEIPKEYLLNSRIGDTKSLDLGCGRFPRNPLGASVLIGCDILDLPPFKEDENAHYLKVLPSEPLPIDSNSLNCVTAYDFIEHIPRFDRRNNGAAINPFIEIMNEIHRVLINGGIFIAVTPCFPSAAAFGDPTHQNVISEGTHEYFSGYTFAKTHGYGFHGSFKKIEVKRIPLKGILWQIYFDSTSAREQNSTRKTKLKEKKIIRQMIRMSKAALGRHHEEIHLLWVFEKNESQ